MEQIDALYATNLEEGPSNVPKAIAISTSFNLGYIYLCKTSQISAYIYIRGTLKADHPKAQKYWKKYGMKSQPIRWLIKPHSKKCWIATYSKQILYHLNRKSVCATVTRWRLTYNLS